MEFQTADLDHVHLAYVRQQLATNAEDGRLLGRLLGNRRLEDGRLWAIVPTERMELAVSDLRSDPIRGTAERHALMVETVRQLRPLLAREPRRLLAIEYFSDMDDLSGAAAHAFLVRDSAFDYVTPSDPDELIAKLMGVSLWFPTIGVIGRAPTDVALPGTRELEVEHVKEIVDNLDLLLIGAWDADGYVFWEPASEGSDSFGSMDSK